MSALADHPNTVEAREFRSQAVMHAARSLFRDPDWLDPTGDLAVWDWLCEIPYMDSKRRRDQMRAWLHNAHVDGSDPVAALPEKGRRLLVLQMSRFAKGQS